MQNPNPNPYQQAVLQSLQNAGADPLNVGMCVNWSRGQIVNNEFREIARNGWKITGISQGGPHGIDAYTVVSDFGNGPNHDIIYDIDIDGEPYNCPANVNPVMAAHHNDQTGGRKRRNRSRQNRKSRKNSKGRKATKKQRRH